MRTLLLIVVLSLACAANGTRFIYSVGEPCTLVDANPFVANDTQCGSLAGFAGPGQFSLEENGDIRYQVDCDACLANCTNSTTAPGVCVNASVPLQVWSYNEKRKFQVKAFSDSACTVPSETLRGAITFTNGQCLRDYYTNERLSMLVSDDDTLFYGTNCSVAVGNTCLQCVEQLNLPLGLDGNCLPYTNGTYVLVRAASAAVAASLALIAALLALLML